MRVGELTVQLRGYKKKITSRINFPLYSPGLITMANLKNRMVIPNYYSGL